MGYVFWVISYEGICVVCPRLRSRTKIIFVHKIFGKILDKGGVDIVHL